MHASQSDDRRGLPSASSWRRLELCAGSWQLGEEAKRIGQEAHKSSRAAARGSLIHAWLAGLPDEDGNEIKLMEPEQRTADFLQARAQEQIERIFGDAQVDTLIEKRLWLKVDGRPALSGQFDKVVYSGDTALILDYKSGHSEPNPAEQNAQLKVLAVLVALALPQVTTVHAQIISGPYGVTEAIYSITELSHAYNEILGTLRAIHADDAPFHPSPEACRFCGAINVCSAVKGLVGPVAKTQLSALPSGDRGAKLLDEVELLQRHLDSIREYYYDRLSQDPTFDLPGYGLQPGAIRREIKDWETARQRLGEWLEMDEIAGAANYRLMDLERALGKKLNLRGKELKERFNTILQNLIQEIPNKSSLKRMSGKPKLVTLELP